jgi:Putative transposase
MLPPGYPRRRPPHAHNIEANTRLRHPLSTLHERRCRRPCKTRFRLAGCAFAGRVSNPLDRFERFQDLHSILLSRACPVARIVYAKPPFAGSEAVLAYLSRYTHRVAISNSRLLRFDEAGVTFRYKDYRRDGADRQQTMTLATDEFIRRFLLHVLPRGFHRIRHYGRSPVPPERPASPAPASCWTSRCRPTTRPKRYSTHARHARPAAGTWSSSRPSNAGDSPARH